MDMKWILLPVAAGAALMLLHRKRQPAEAAPQPPQPAPQPLNTLDRELASRIAEFIDLDRFSLVIQPVVDLQTNTIIGGEVLSRLNHPERGVIFPDDFLPSVDAAGLYSRFDKYIFHKCCAWLSRTDFEGEKMDLVSCNFSRKTLSEPGIAALFARIADSYGLPHNRLGIEIMEQESETDTEQFYSNLKQLKASGFCVMLDDFGSGITSVQDILREPLDIVKIDRSVLLDAGTDQGRAAYRSMVEMVKKQGLKVVCEGIETEAQRDFAREVGCHYGQGFLFYRPLRTDQVFEMIEKSSVAPDWEEV